MGVEDAARRDHEVVQVKLVRAIVVDARDAAMRDWETLHTDDGSLSAQFEHTVVVTHGRPQILTLAAARG